MNKLQGSIKNITKDEAIQILEILADGVLLSAIRTEGNGVVSQLNIGDHVTVSFKETAMSISKNLSGEISIQNRFEVRIMSITTDRVLSKLFLDFKGRQLISVITTTSVKRMQLKPGDQVQGLVKTTDMLFSKIDS